MKKRYCVIVLGNFGFHVVKNLYEKGAEVIYPEQDMAVKIARALATPNIMDFIPLAEEYSISEIDPPAHFIGKSLIDLNLRKKFQVTVIAVKDMLSDEFIAVPRPEHVIKDSDMLILIGKMADIEKAMKK